MLGRWSAVVQQQAALATCGARLTHGDLFRVHPSVSKALEERKPVVALESTIITHGMPYPHNLSTAEEVEAIVRSQGATPATVGLLGGRIHLGLFRDELRHLAQNQHSVKVSCRDLAYAISKGLSGGTTVSATMIAAHQAGIPVFVTGGIGGVHRNGENKLGRTPIAVVCAGVKSILDIGRTLEYLETHGVCVATLGKSTDFPAFFTPKSGFHSPCNVANPKEAAQLIMANQRLGLQSGLLLAVPIPEEHAHHGQEIQQAVQAAVTEACAKGIRGKEVTPFILQRVSDLTKGRSLQANVALICNNAKVGAQVACALSEEEYKRKPGGSSCHKGKVPGSQGKTIVVGGINVDFIAKGRTNKLLFGQTNPGSVLQSFGGVGRNIADCLSRLSEPPLFISAIGRDSHSKAVVSHCKHMDMTAVARIPEHSTATYCAVMTDSGELSLGLGDMEIHQQITEQRVSQFKSHLSSAAMVVLDGNVPVATVDYVCSAAQRYNVPVWYEPTDRDKAAKPFLSDSWKALTYTSPNLAELFTMNQTLGLETPAAPPSGQEELLQCAAALSRPLLEHLRCVVVTLGPLGVLVCGEHWDGAVCLQPRPQSAAGQLCAVHYPALAVPPEDVVNVSGAGDSLAGSMIAGILQRCESEVCVRMGLLAAHLSLTSPDPIAPSLSPQTVCPKKVRTMTWPRPTLLWMDKLRGFPVGQ